jgi:hypothetical protein
MNQEQRKYLISQVESTLRQQVEELEKQKPKQPSLNNYLIAAFMDNSIEFADLSPLKDKIRERVLKMGREDVLIEENDEDNWYSSRKRKDTKNNYVKLLAEEIFVIPENYKKALSEYQQKIDEIEGKVKMLNAQCKTITMKIQIGSAGVLDKLVQQIDNMADLNIINNQLLLT